MRHSQRTREKVIKEFRKVGRVDLACAAAGVDRTTHYWWMKNDPEYRKSFEEAREEGPASLRRHVAPAGNWWREGDDGH